MHLLPFVGLPLQLGLPIAELRSIGLVLLLSGGIGYLVYRDASNRDVERPLLWAVAIALLLVPLVPGLLLLGVYVFFVR
jgi:hypothetical protein